MRTPPLLLSISLLVTCISYAQSGREIYLGDDMDTHYAKSDCAVITSHDSTVLKFAGYHIFSHELIDSATIQKLNRAGLVLNYKSTDETARTERILWGDEKDSIEIIYRSTREDVTHGRSATVSIMNLFSKKSDREKQEAPYQELVKKEKEGALHAGEEIAHFYCSWKSIAHNQLQGWLAFRGDTLKLGSAEYYRKLNSNKVKKAHGYNDEGLQLMKGSACLAAMGFTNGDNLNTFFTSKELPEKDKRIITAFFFIAVSY